MITLFNRKELLITYDMSTLAKVRTILESNNIEHKVRTTNTLSPSSFNSHTKTRGVPYGLDHSKTHEYKIYVKVSEYEKVFYLINKNN
ncbi:MAG: hypothetical protein E7191_03910 [Erysipelotrichaceae bacterium]|nr:hypothetical protein [Erysipelotrichaceae bacterium]